MQNTRATKRSSTIHRQHFRKRPIRLKPLAALIATLFVGCSARQDAQVVASVPDCANNTKLTLQECEAAYQKALAASEKTAPKYATENQCEAEFGADQCTKGRTGSFMPFMTGFLVSSLLDFSRNYFNPVYQYRGPGAAHGRIMTPHGQILGPAGHRRYKVRNETLTKPIPTVQRTVSRGGFGSQAAAKSNWGGSSRRSGGWGG